MKQLSIASDKIIYRYLKNRDHFDFHGEVFNIFYKKSDGSNFLQSAFQDLLHHAFCNPSPTNAEQNFQTHQQLVVLLELAYLLHEDRDDLEYVLHGELIDDHPSFKLSGELKTGITPCNAQTRVNDKPESPRVFFQSFYQERSLTQWRSIVDELLHLATGHQSQDSKCIFTLSEVINIQSYFQKLIANIHLVYTDTVLPHIRQHHPGKLYLKTSGIQFSSVKYFPADNFEQVIQLIALAIQPEAIYCVNRQQLSCGTDHADLILVIPDSHRSSFADVQQFMEFALGVNQQVSFSIYKSKPFYGLLSVGHVYYSLTCDDNALLYVSGDHTPPARPRIAPDRIEKINKHYYDGQDKAKRFLANAQCTKGEDLAFATYMLHQAAELSLRALNRALCAQDKPTHSLSKLLEISKRITADLSLCMLDGTEQSAELLELLDASYLGYRYTEQFEVDDEQFDVLFCKVALLQQTSESTYLSWITRYANLFNLPSHDEQKK